LTDHIDGDHDLGDSATPAAVAGYPHISVPMGFVLTLPVGISFFGRACSEPILLKFGKPGRSAQIVCKREGPIGTEARIGTVWYEGTPLTPR